MKNKVINLKPVKRQEILLPLTIVKNYYNNFEVRPANNTSEVYSPVGYSKYSQRWKAYNKGKIKGPGQVYGMEQALEHIDEIRQAKEKGKFPHARKEFEIVEVTIIKTIFKTKRVK